MKTFLSIRLKGLIGRSLFVVLLLLGYTTVQGQANFTSNATGNWGSSGTWTLVSGTDADGIPDSNDNVTIDSNNDVTVAANAACNTLTINGNSNNQTTLLTIDSGFTLSVGGAFSITAGTGNRKAGLTVNGTIQFAGTTTFNSSNVVYSLGSSCTFEFNGVTQTVPAIPGPTPYVNLTLSNSGVKTTAGITVNGVLSMEGTATASAAPTYGSAATLQYNTATARTINTTSNNGIEWPTTFSATGGVVIANTGKITMAGSGRTIASGSKITINSGATFDPGSLVHTISGGASLLVNGTLDFSNVSGEIRTGTSGTSTLTMGSAGLIKTIDAVGVGPAANASLSTQSGGVWSENIASAGTVEYYRSTDNTGVITDRNYNNLIISTTGTKTWTLSATRTVAGTITINADLTLSGTQIINVGGDWSRTAIFTPGTSTINFNGTTQAITGSTFNNLSLSNNGTKTFGSLVTINANLSIASGVVANLGTGFTHSVGTLTLGGLGVNSGTWGSTSSSATYKNNTYFTATTGVLSIGTDTRTTPTVTPTVGTYTYTGLAQGPNSATNSGTGTSYTFSYNGTGGTVYGPSATLPTNAGTYTVTVTVAASTDGFYKSNSSAATAFSILTRALSITANNGSKTYGQTYAVGSGSTAFTSSGLQNGETLGTITTASTGAVNTAAAGSYSLVPSSATGGTFNAANYSITYNNGTLTVNAAPLSITANNGSKTYGQTYTVGSGSTAFTSSGLQNGETIGSITTASTGAVNTAAVGSYSIVPSSATAGTFNAANYNITYNNGTLTVNTAALSITANNGSKTYGQTYTVGSGSTAFTSSGLQNGETIGSITIASTGAVSTAVVGSYSIIPTAATAGTFNASNYSITYNNGTLTVNAASLSITANNGSKTYGQTYTVGSGSTDFTSSGLQNGETVGSITIASTGAVNTAAVGSYSIVSSSAVGGTFDAANYNITYNNGTLTVNAAALSITADNASKCEGTTYTFGTTAFTSSGLQNSETIGGVTLTSSGAASGAVAGGYAIVPSAATGGSFNASNYSITYINGTLTVIAAPNAPVGTDGERCNSGTVNLSAAVGAGETVDWYDASTGGTLLLSGSTLFTTPSISSTTVYYAQTRNTTSGCISLTRTAVTATVSPTSVGGSVTGGTTVCSGSTSGLLTLSGHTGTVVRWESSVSPFSTWTTIANTSSTYTSGALTQTTKFRAVVQSGSCSEANSADTTVTVDAATVAGSVTGGTPICAGSTSGLLMLSGYTGTIVRWESSVSPFSSWSTIANTTDTYTSGVLTQTTRFRAVVQSGSCSEVASAYTSVDINTTTWSSGSWNNGAPNSTTAAVISSSFISGGVNLEACSLTINNNATVVISSGDTVTLSGALTAVPGSLVTFNNNANLIQSGTTNANSGAIIIKRSSSPLMRLDYTLWSSPVANQQLQAFSPQTLSNRFYTYTTYDSVNPPGPTNNTNLYTAVNPSTTNFATATGYLIRMPNNHPTTPTVWTGQFAGVPNNGDYSYTLVDGGAGKRFNLVGNPYPSPIDATAFVGDANNTSSITGTLYFWRKTNNVANPSYCTWTLGGFVGNGQPYASDPNDVIQVGQGFFVEGTGSGTVNFTNNMRIDDHANQFFKTAAVERNRIWLNATNASGMFSQTMVGYMTNATQGIDPTIDGKYINDGGIAFASLIDATPYAIQGRALPFDAADVVPMYFKTDADGEYTIAIDHTDGLFAADQPVYLRDNITGVIHDLHTGGYTFSATAGSYDARFEVLYQLPLGYDAPVFHANQVVIYKNTANEFVINTGSAVMNTVKVYDIQGRLLLERKGINASQTTVNAGMTNEVLLVQITSEEGTVVTKKVIR
ncbi:hypothetical protein EZL74_11000 [Flavobacterium silvisoli]|uniref:T9SS sorting signal type C domain-containing protein n=1 Tax=Flavobacterium silvisoli TaxID=2529433 RepID=A0A4Q9YS28_9FLAO|nr:MBG domain-containing protein [Flavobacterium silvisoli]TBX66369.1 hypothetical protein EZL74_11000 [Flavobacterium silvisoli]